MRQTLGGIEFMRETELKEALAQYRADYSEVQNELKDVQTKIDEYRKNEESEEETIKLLEKDLADANMKIGLTDVNGEGITITITNTTEGAVSYSDLLGLVNELILAGAEAISINDQRIVAMSDIVSPDNFILVNLERVSSPFVVKAIGDTKHLESALSIKGGYIDINGDKYDINLKTGNVQINKYDRNLTLDYVKK
jgi:uncharacterized protein YlxW (UPF0749 family)